MRGLRPISLGGAALTVVALLIATAMPPSAGIDLTTYLIGAKLLVGGANPYDGKLIDELAAASNVARSIGDAPGMLPGGLLVFVPLLLLETTQARIAWAACLGCSLSAVVWLALRRGHEAGEMWRPRPEVLTLLLPAISSIVVGQVTPICLLLLQVACLPSVRARIKTTAFLVALTATLKPTLSASLLLPLMLASRDRRGPALAYTGLFLAAIQLPALFFDPHALLQFRDLVSEIASNPPPNFYLVANISVRSFIAKQGAQLIAGVAALIAIPALASALVRLRSSTASDVSALALVPIGAIGALSSPYFWDHMLILLLPAACVPGLLGTRTSRVVSACVAAQFVVGAASLRGPVPGIISAPGLFALLAIAVPAAASLARLSSGSAR